MNTRAHVGRSPHRGISPRFDDAVFLHQGVANLCDPESDLVGAARWERYAREGIGVWDEALEDEDAGQGLHVAFVAEVVAAAAQLKDQLARGGANVIMAVHAQEAEVSLVELNEQANGGHLPPDARAFWADDPGS